MLIQILNYLKREKIATDQQLAREFNLDLSALAPMLDLWVRRGAVICCQEQQSCQQGCVKSCQKQRPVYYRYVS